MDGVILLCGLIRTCVLHEIVVGGLPLQAGMGRLSEHLQEDVEELIEVMRESQGSMRDAGVRLLTHTPRHAALFDTRDAIGGTGFGRYCCTVVSL